MSVAIIVVNMKKLEFIALLVVLIVTISGVNCENEVDSRTGKLRKKNNSILHRGRTFNIF